MVRYSKTGRVVLGKDSESTKELTGYHHRPFTAVYLDYFERENYLLVIIFALY
jgi:hypothetical protein